jgi:hypothetical protein
MDLGSTQPLTEMRISNFPEGKGPPARNADKITAICELTLEKYGSLDLSQPYELSRPGAGKALPSYIYFNILSRVRG